MKPRMLSDILSRKERLPQHESACRISSKYVFTMGIAKRIARKLTEQGTEAEVPQVDSIHNPSGYDAFIIGSPV